jgi:hypothetical protein
MDMKLTAPLLFADLGARSDTESPDERRKRLDRTRKRTARRASAFMAPLNAFEPATRTTSHGGHE